MEGEQIEGLYSFGRQCRETEGQYEMRQGGARRDPFEKCKAISNYPRSRRQKGPFMFVDVSMPGNV